MHLSALGAPLDWWTLTATGIAGGPAQPRLGVAPDIRRKVDPGNVLTAATHSADHRADSANYVHSPSPGKVLRLARRPTSDGSMVSGPTEKLDLAQQPDFRLGGLLVSPSTGRVRGAGAERRVEPRVMEVLVVLAHAEGRTVTREQLIDACWGGRVVSDDAITRIVAKVRALGRSASPLPFELETIPKVGFRLIASDEIGGRSGPQPVGSPRSRLPVLKLAVVGLLVLAMAGGIALLRLPRDVAPTARVEVMLFEPLQPDPALQRLSVLVGDALARTLTRSGIDAAKRPLPRDDAREGRQSAEFRVAGTVDRQGETYVVDAQVIDRRTGNVLWSGRLDRPVAQVVGFQEAAASRIADVLHCALTHRADSNRRIETPVFGLLLNACEARRGADPRGRFGFVEIAGRLVRAAPDLSVAHSLQAVAFALAANDVPESGEVARFRASARASARRALELDPRNGEAHFALALNHGPSGRWVERERDFLRAAEVSPSLSVVRNYYAGLLREVGRRKAALQVSERVVAADPFSSFQLYHLAALVAAEGDPERAATLIDRIALIDPQMADQRRLQVLLWWTEPNRARRELADLRRPDIDDASRACFDTHLARVAERRGAQRLGLPPTCDGVQGDIRVRMLSRQGDVDGAYAELVKRPPSSSAASFLFFPEMKAFRQDARFMPLAARLGLVDYWQKTGNWPDFCAEPDLPYDCAAVAGAT